VNIKKVCEGKKDCKNGDDEGEGCDFDECENKGGL
jgi:hypothetical protein